MKKPSVIRIAILGLLASILVGSAWALSPQETVTDSTQTSVERLSSLCPGISSAVQNPETQEIRTRTALHAGRGNGNGCHGSGQKAGRGGRGAGDGTGNGGNGPKDGSGPRGQAGTCVNS